MIVNMFLNSQLTKYTSVYVDNIVRYSTHYNGMNCTYNYAHTIVKHKNWPIIRYLFVSVCMNLLKYARDPYSPFGGTSLCLLVCVVVMLVVIFNKSTMNRDNDG